MLCVCSHFAPLFARILNARFSSLIALRIHTLARVPPPFTLGGNPLKPPFCSSLRSSL